MSIHCNIIQNLSQFVLTFFLRRTVRMRTIGGKRVHRQFGIKLERETFGNMDVFLRVEEPVVFEHPVPTHVFDDEMEIELAGWFNDI